MSVIGIDIGNENCYISVARAGGIETIANEYSQRSTPTYVAFGDKTRDLGVSAKNKQITNIQNTIFGFKRLIGRKFRDNIVKNELAYLPYNVCELPNGDVGIKAMYLGYETVFTVQQVMAMMLTKLKEIAENALQIKVQDCVISVPVFFNDTERRAMLEAAQIAGLNPLRLMNETTAVALSYGFYKQDLSEDKPKKVVFVDLGNSLLQITACAFTKGKLQVLASVWDRNIGGRNFDDDLMRHFAEDFRQRYRINSLSNKRATVRLLQECEKLKKQMSANSLELPLNIECFMNDKDVSGRMKRDHFEKLSADLLNNIEKCMHRLLNEANLKADEVDSIQIVGGSSRLPAVKVLVQKVFGKEPSTTLNQDEAVARGCALMCAMLSPTLKVKDFAVADIQPYPIKISWKALKSEESTMVVFKKFDQVPFVRKVTLERKEPFSIEASYDGSDTSYGDAHIGTFTMQNITPNPEGGRRKVKVKVRVDIHGIFSISSASVEEKRVVAVAEQNEVKDKVNSNEAANKQNAEEAMDVENNPTKPSPNGEINDAEINEKSEAKEMNENQVAEPKKTKTMIYNVEVPVSAVIKQLSKDELDGYIEKEAQMILQDKVEKEKADAKNAVEEYVYEMRGKIGDEYEEFVSDQEREKFRHLLDDTEEWLYGDGENEKKTVYADKLKELRKTGDVIVSRYFEWHQRPQAMDEFGRSLQAVQKAMQAHEADDERYSHIEKEDMQKVHDAWKEKCHSHGQYLRVLSKLHKHENPPVTVNEIRQERQNFENIVNPILNKPKPKVEPPPEQVQAGGDEAQNASCDSEMVDENSLPNESKQQTQDGPTNSQTEQMETN